MTPTLNLHLIYLMFLVIVFIYFLLVFMFLGGQHLGFSPLGVSCSSAGSSKAFLGRDGGFVPPSVTEGFPSLLSITHPAKKKNNAGTKVSAEKTQGMRGTSVWGEDFVCLSAA